MQQPRKQSGGARPLGVLDACVLLALALGAACAVSPIEGDDAAQPDIAPPDAGDAADTVMTDTADAISLDVEPDAGRLTDTLQTPDAAAENGGAVEDGRNACGGAAVLAGIPLTSCGSCDDGVWACDGRDAVVCLGGTLRNVCGGCGTVAAAPGTPCGPCGGIWECDTGSGDVRCVGAVSRNACGGCTALPNTPNFGCFGGVYACDGPNGLVCAPIARNACGGVGVLDPAPGAACGICGTGRVVCDSPETTVCVDDTVGINACGVCGALPATVGTSCGCGGTWTCEGTTLTCVGDAGRNACGGCGALSDSPNAACVDGAVRCDGSDATWCRATETNACGGTVSLDGTPGATCGPCADGVVVCVTAEAVQCVGASAPHACGGCGVLPGRVGGLCGTGRAWACEDGALVCVAPPSRNACGGETTLSVAPGTVCGSCGGGLSVCVSREEVACLGALSRPPNVCGGCETLPRGATPGAACGICQTGSWACQGIAEIVCAGERPEVQRLFYADRDGDGAGNPAETRLACAQPVGFVTNDEDCDDRDPSSYPGAVELCDGADNDCDSAVDEGYLFYPDADGDGFGRNTQPRTVCSGERGWARVAGDCDDNDARAFSGQVAFFDTSRPNGSFDFDCDGTQELEVEVFGACRAQDILTCGIPSPLGSYSFGWASRLPDCGTLGSWVRTCTIVDGQCRPVTEVRRQGCR